MTNGRYRVGIDIGGTFTDFSLLDEVTGELASFKSPTVPGDPGRGVLDGVRALVTERGLDPGAIDYLVHGTTIAINTVIQRNGASLGLLVTAGFGDLLEIQRLRLASPVNFTATRPLPLIPRYRVGEVTERILADGTVDTALDHEELLREATRLVEREGAEALVVSFVNAYRTPAHEAEARKVLAEHLPRVHVTCSHEVWPQIREYERTMVAILSAYVRPRVDQYLAQLERELGGAGVRVPLHITKSNGGVTTARDARQATAETMLSGPASGVIGATSVCVRAGYRDLITFDMKERGIEPVMSLALERGSTDATAQALRIKSANADFVLGCLYEAELAILLRDLHKYGVSVPVIGALGADFESTHKRVNNPAAVKNFYLPYQFQAPMGSPVMKKWEDMFVKNLEKSELPENGVPTNFYYFGLPTAIATVEAFKRAGPQPSREKFIAAMETLKDFDTGVLADKVTITRDNHVGVHVMYAVGLNDQGKQTVFTGWGKPLQ